MTENTIKLPEALPSPMATIDWAKELFKRVSNYSGVFSSGYPEAFADELVNAVVDGAVEYIDDFIHAFADDAVDLYNFHLFQWLKNCDYATDYMEDAVNECMIDTAHYDFCKHIQVAQYLYIEEETREGLKDAIRYAVVRVAAKDHPCITEDQMNEIEDLEPDDFNSLDDIRDKIKEIFESEE